MLDLFDEKLIDGKLYVRKERLDVLNQQFDAVCQAHAEFVDKVYDALMRNKNQKENCNVYKKGDEDETPFVSPQS